MLNLLLNHLIGFIILLSLLWAIDSVYGYKHRKLNRNPSVRPGRATVPFFVLLAGIYTSTLSSVFETAPEATIQYSYELLPVASKSPYHSCEIPSNSLQPNIRRVLDMVNSPIPLRSVEERGM